MVNNLSLSLLLFIFIQTTGCKGQEFQYKNTPLNYLPFRNPMYIAELDNLKDSATDLTEYLPSNYIKDGSRDYTVQLQQGIDSNNLLLMPDFPVMTSGLRLHSGTTLIFQKNSLLLLAPSNQPFYEVIEINKVHDVNVYFAKVVGDRRHHMGTSGEWGFGIGIEASNNIKIISASISDCWGDGIYINNKTSQLERTDSSSRNNNILIDGAILDNNRRNGLSLIDGNNITIRNSVISNTNGKMPMCGIDIEPNNGEAELKNIMIDNITTFNNQNFGVFVSLTSFISTVQKEINITISNCTDDGSNYGMGYAFGRSKAADLIYATGSINVINPIWKNNRSGQLWLPYYASKNSIVLKFQNAKVFKKGETKTSPLSPVILSLSKNIILN